MGQRITILSQPEEVIPFVADARAASDTAKNSLGFLPERVYKEAAEQRKLLVAVAQDRHHCEYAGHLLHGGVFPVARIFQIFVSPRCRGKGIGSRLVRAVVNAAEQLQFTSVVARVGADLEANVFWESLEFHTVRTVAGGQTTGRQINIRVRDLDTPRLFATQALASEAIADELGLMPHLFDVSPTYVIDLNVVYDLVKKRRNADEVGRIVRASFSNMVRLAVAEEFVKELERTSISAIDPMLELAAKLPRLPAAPKPELTKIITHLKKLVFADKIASGKLKPQDSSDLVHLATAIYHEAAGFITSEKAILRARLSLQKHFSLDVVGPGEFAAAVEPQDTIRPSEVSALAGTEVLKTENCSEIDRTLLQDFLDRIDCPGRFADEALKYDRLRPQRRILIKIGDRPIGFGVWTIPSNVSPFTQAFVCVDEEHMAAAAAAEFLVDSVSRELLGSPAQIDLKLLPGTAATKRAALGHGFRPSPNDPASGSNLRKVALGAPVTTRNWDLLRQQLKARMKISLPITIPSYKSPADPITILGPAGTNISVQLYNLESLLSPAIFFLPNRPVALAPIRRSYAAELIGGAAQLNMLAGPEAAILRERAYFSDRRTSRVLRKGIPILFYESGYKEGRSSVIGAARAVRTEIVDKSEKREDLLRRGVLNMKHIRKISSADTIAATTIDNIIVFKNPVGLKKLREIGAIDDANLVTSRNIAAETADQIVNEGWTDA